MADSLVRTVAEVVHDHVQRNSPVWLAKDGLVVPRDKTYVVERLESVRQDGGIRERLRGVVNQPPGYVPV